jgi:hypothetical protein
MQYISPIKLLDLKIPKSGEGLREYDLVRERKRILAEFELQKSATIEIKRKELDKLMVVQFFDELADPTLCKYHEAIFRDKNVMYFLEYNVIEKKAWKLKVEMMENVGFRAFVRPYFIHSYNQVMTEATSGREIIKLQNLLSKPMLVSPCDYEYCYSGTIGHLNSLLNYCQTHIYDDREFGFKSIKDVSNSKRVLVLNALPDYFNQLKDDYALALCNLAIEIESNENLYELWEKPMSSALGIECSPDTKRFVLKKNNELIQ